MSKTPTIDDLLKAKRQSSGSSRPSDGFWDAVFAPRLTNRLMAALSQPRHEGRTLRIIGWTTPVVFGSLLIVSVGIAYFFSPERAISRWEAQASSKNYVVDNMKDETPAKAFGVDGSSYTMKTGNGVNSANASSGVMSYQFTAASTNKSEF